MGQGRSSAILAMIFVCPIYFEIASAAIYTVGDAKGWTFNVAAWPKGKRFRCSRQCSNTAQQHISRVHATQEKGQKCTVDKIKLVKGPNYFICTFPGHCQSAMKVAINAL